MTSSEKKLTYAVHFLGGNYFVNFLHNCYFLAFIVWVLHVVFFFIFFDSVTLTVRKSNSSKMFSDVESFKCNPENCASEHG